jgi:hypothetical protein
MTAAELLTAAGIVLPNLAPGRHYTTCPRCSHMRRKAKDKCLGVTIDDDDSVRWGCNHCQWQGPEKGTGAKAGNGKTDPHDNANFIAFYDYPGFQKVKFPKDHEPRFLLRYREGGEWKWGTGGADTSVLYRIDEAREAIAQGYRIAVAVGEIDVYSLWEIGFPAVFYCHGASVSVKKP